MTTGNVCRRVLDSALPGGPVWNTNPGGSLDKFFNGTAQNFEDMREIAAAVADVRDPEKTSALSDLEIEFGIVPDENISTATRRQYLAALMGERTILPSAALLEAKLRAAGFDVYVYANEPPIDPATVMAAHAEGYWLVNGPCVVSQGRDYTTTVCSDSSGETTVCDDDGTEDVPDRGATVCAFEGMLREFAVYETPTRYRWPLIFWIAASKSGGETFDDWNMERATVDAWDDGGDASLTKSFEWKASGLRSLEVMATAGWSDPIGPYAEQLRTAIASARTITVSASASATVKAGMVVCDKDGTWDDAGIVTSATGSSGETLTYAASNGVSGVRLYVTTGSAAPVIGDVARFDNLLIDNLTFGSASISDQYRDRFERLVLRYKPLRTWAGVLIEWTTTPPAPGGFDEDDA